MTPPLYDVNTVVYLKESAALGFLEAVSISGISREFDRWIYTIRTRSGLNSAVGLYGDRISVSHGKLLRFNEDELVSMCDALRLAVANQRSVLEKLEAQLAIHCPSTE